jgi:hypothetical protein
MRGILCHCTARTTFKPALRIIDIILVKNNVDKNGNQHFFFLGKWILEENGISFLEENGYGHINVEINVITFFTSL